MSKRGKGTDTRLTKTLPEVARLMGIGRNQAYEAAKNRVIPTIRIGRRLVVPVAALERLLLQGDAEKRRAP